MNQAMTDWRITGEMLASCNCDWGCPCQFDALPTHGRCEGAGALEIRKGHFGSTSLDGVRFVQIVWWPGPMHEGNGTRQLIVDAGATEEQRSAIAAITSGGHGGGMWEIYSSVCPNVLETVSASILFDHDRERRQARLEISGLLSVQAEPIKTRVTGEEHRARIVIPGGFEFEEAEMANAVSLEVSSSQPLVFKHENSYGGFNTFDLSGA